MSLSEVLDEMAQRNLRMRTEEEFNKREQQVKNMASLLRRASYRLHKANVGPSKVLANQIDDYLQRNDLLGSILRFQSEEVQKMLDEGEIK